MRCVELMSGKREDHWGIEGGALRAADGIFGRTFGDGDGDENGIDGGKFIARDHHQRQIAKPTRSSRRVGVYHAYLLRETITPYS